MKTVFKIKHQLNKHRLTQFSNKYVTNRMGNIIDPAVITNVFNSMSLPDAFKALLNVNWNNDSTDTVQTHVGQIVDAGQASTRNNLAVVLNNDGEKLLIIAEAAPTQTGLSLTINIGYSGDRSNFDLYLQELNIDINDCDILYMSDK